jgi:hypothetical protein
MAKKTYAGPQTLEARVEEVIRRVDPLQAAVMVLGGTAAACGITPPMTALLDALTSSGPVKDIWHLITTPGYQLIGEWVTGTPSSNPTELSHRQLALFCSGAVEACIMYALVSNPETFKQILAIPGQAVQGIGKLASIIK